MATYHQLDHEVAMKVVVTSGVNEGTVLQEAGLPIGE